jgi:hypothetical protein
MLGITPKDPAALVGATADDLVMRDHRPLATHTRTASLAGLRRHPAEGETVLIDHAVEPYRAAHKVDGTPETFEWRELAPEMKRAETDPLDFLDDDKARQEAWSPSPVQGAPAARR